MAKAASAKETARKAVLTLKVTLRGVKPPVWRRLVAPGSLTLAGLHDAIQGAMGWYDCHLHQFEVDDREYGNPSLLEGVANEKRATLTSHVNTGVRRIAGDIG